MKQIFNFLNEENGEMISHYSNFVFGIIICACTSTLYNVYWINITSTLSSIGRILPQ